MNQQKSFLMIKNLRRLIKAARRLRVEGDAYEWKSKFAVHIEITTKTNFERANQKMKNLI